VLDGVWRHLVFRPHAADDPATREHLEHVGDRAGAGGVPVGVYRQSAPPPVEVLAWRPGHGAVVTAFNPEHRYQVGRYLDGVEVADGAIPRVSYGRPFAPGEARTEQQRDRLVFEAGGTGADEQVIHISPSASRRVQARPDMPRHLVARAAASEGGPVVKWMGAASRAGAIEDGVARIASSLRRVG
jgi:hypothetical protein